MLRLLAARVAVLAGLAMVSRPSLCKQLQRVGRFGHAFLFGHGQDLVLQLGASHVVEHWPVSADRRSWASAGMKASVASTSDVLPAAELLCDPAPHRPRVGGSPDWPATANLTQLTIQLPTDPASVEALTGPLQPTHKACLQHSFYADEFGHNDRHGIRRCR